MVTDSSPKREIPGRSLAARRERAVTRNRDLVEWAGDLAYSAGACLPAWQALKVRRVLEEKNGKRHLSKLETRKLPVWTSPAIVINEEKGDKLLVAVTKIDQIYATRRMRLGYFVIGLDEFYSSPVGCSADFDSPQQLGRWLTSYGIDGTPETHRKPEEQSSEHDEINVALSKLWIRGPYLSRAEENLHELEAERVVVDSSIENNDYNLHLRELLSAISVPM